MVASDLWRHEPVELVAMPTSTPDRVGAAEVARIRVATQTFRTLDARYGGGACHDAVLAFLTWGRRLLDADASDEIARRLYVALADLYNVAGWTAFDLNRVDPAHRYFDRAFTLAQLGGDGALMADVGYRKGRIHLHHNSPDKAQREFQLGQYSAQSCGSAIASAILYTHQAWACAKMGRAAESLTMLGHGVDEFLRCAAARPAIPAWARFFDTIQLSAISGAIYAELAQLVDPAYARFAVPALTRAVHRAGPERTRGTSFTLMALATSHLVEGRPDHALHAGERAVEMARDVRSVRTVDRLRLLRDEADRLPGNADARELSLLVTEFIDGTASRED